MNVSTSRPSSLRHVVRRALVLSTATVAISGAAFVTVAWMAHEATPSFSYGPSTRGYESQIVDSSPPSAPAVDKLVGQHDCWTNDTDMPPGMAGRLPGHVVVSTSAAAQRPTYSADLVGPALDQVFSTSRTTNASTGALTVYAFCR